MTRTSKALRRLGVSGLAAATVLSVAPLLGATAAQAAGTPLLVANDCTQQSTATTTTTSGNTNGAVGTAGTNPSNETGAGSGCTTQAQINTVKTLTFTYTEGGSPVAGRTIDFTLEENPTPTGPQNQQATTASPAGATPFSANFPNQQPSGTNSGPDTANRPGQVAACTTDANGQCSVNITDSEPELVRVDARERQTGALANEFIEFRTNSVAVQRINEIERDIVAPEGTNAALVDPTPGRPVELTYTAYDANGDCNAASTATCTGAIVRSQEVTVSVNQAAYFTPNCTPRDASATGSPQRSTAGTPAAGTTAAQSSTGTLAEPDYRACSFTGTPADGNQTSPLTSLGQTITVRTDQDGRFTVTVVEGRDVEFDNNGIAVVTVSLTVGGNTFTAREPAGGTPGTRQSATGANCNTTNVSTGVETDPNPGDNEAGCNVAPLVFTTRSSDNGGTDALNGADVEIVRVDGGADFGTGTTQAPNRETQAPVYVVQLRDQYGNLTTADQSGTDPNNLATLTKEGVGELDYCGTGGSTPNSPCGGGTTTATQVSTVTQNDGTITETWRLRGSFTDLTEQERFRSRTVNDINGQPINGTQTLTAKWVAPETEYRIGSTTNPFSTGGAGNNFASPGFAQNETDNVHTDVVTISFYTQQAAKIVWSANPGTSVPVGTVVTLTATVTDQFNQPLSFYDTSFFRGGTSNDCTATATNQTGGNQNGSLNTDRQGRAFFSFSCSTASNQNVTLVVFDDLGAEIGRSTQSVQFTGAGVQPTNTATPTATATATPTQAPGCTTARQNLPFTIQDADKTVGATAPVNVLIRGAQPGATVELEAYQQNHYGTANFTNAANTRTAVANSAGEAVIQLRFSSNARMRAKQQGCSFGPNAGYNNPGGNVLFVRVALFMNVTRVGVRTYVISGDSIPARPGGLIVNLYCTDPRCKTPQNPSGIIAQPRANAVNGEYTTAPRLVRFSAAFQGSRVNILALLRGDAQNVAGQSNVRSLLIG